MCFFFRASGMFATLVRYASVSGENVLRGRLGYILRLDAPDTPLTGIEHVFLRLGSFRMD